MSPPKQWFALTLLDTVDLTADLPTEKANLTAALPKLRANLEWASAEVNSSLAPVHAGHPADDTWDDQVFFLRAIAETGYSQKKVAIEAALGRLDEIENNPDPGREVAGWVLDDAVEYLKDVGLDDAALRNATAPLSIDGLPLAEVIWQARNQRHHFNQPEDFHPPTLAAFRRIVAARPDAFSLATPPSSDPDLQSLLKSRSWAPEILVMLGWTSTESIIRDVASIH